MKKLLVFIFFVLAVCGYNFLQPQFLHEIFYEEASNFYIYLNSKIDIPNVAISQNGSGQIVKVDKTNFDYAKQKLNNVGGESVVINGNVSFDKIANKLNLKVVEIANFNNGILVTGYSPKLLTSLYSNSQKINVQIYMLNDYTIIGYPLIMQGF